MERGARSNAHRSAKKKSSDNPLLQVFGMFASGRQRLYWKDFERLCLNTLLFDGQFGHSDARAIFAEFVSGDLRYIVRQQFEPLLKEVAYHKLFTVEALQRLVIDGANSQQWLK
jgi:hypothetical protein